MEANADREDDAIIQGLFRYDLLNKLPRTGFLMRGVDRPETVGEHVFLTSLLACLLLPRLREDGYELNGEKFLAMALLHESGEILIGDIPSPAAAFFGKEGKSRAELEAGRAVLRDHPENRALMEEFESGAGLEARVVRCLDRLQMMAKVLAYENEGKRGLDEFWEYSGRYQGCGVPRVDRLFARLAALRGKAGLDYLGMLG
jgi:putative hydrolase of HD superfamily